MFSDLSAVEVFLSVCSTGSLQKTAKTLGLSLPAVSRKLSKLEEDLGAELFMRDKRPLEMTKTARAIYASAKKINEEKKRIANICKSEKAESSRVLRVMIGNAQHGFAPQLLYEYSQMLPDLRITAISPSYVEDFLDGKADVISLSGQATPPDCMFLSRGKMIFLPIATPEYIRKNGSIDHPEQLVQHRIFSNLYPERYSFQINYPLTKQGMVTTVQGIEAVRYSNVFLSYQAVLKGQGIGLSMPLYMCIDDLEAGRVVPVLNGWHRPAYEAYVACKKENWNNTTVRLFSVWWAKKLASHHKACEKRLVDLYDRQFLTNLFN